MTATLTRQDVIAALRGYRRLDVSDPVIACDNVDAIPMQDALEVYLALASGGRGVWQDASGRRSRAAALLPAVGHLLRDVATLPATYASYRRDATAAAEAAAHVTPSSRGLSPVLFLRTDHWFNVTSGGSVGHLKGVIDGLRSLGHEVQIVSTDCLAGIPADEHFHLCAPRYGRGRNIPNLPELTHNRALADFVAARWEQWKPQLVYQRLSTLSYIGPWLKARYGVPYVCEYNGSMPWMARHWVRRPLFLEKLALKTERASLANADLIVAVTEESRDELAAAGYAPERILVNPNGVDPEVFHPDIDAGSVRRKYGLEGKLVIGFIGTFGLWHGAEVLAEAFAELVRRRPDLRPSLRLLMIGDGGQRAVAEAIVDRSGVREEVIFAGRLPQAHAPAALAACDVFASPHVPNPDGSPFFGSPTKLFEYMAMGRPIVASNLNQIGRILQHEVTAVLVPPGNAVALSVGLERACDDAGLRQRLGAAARAVVVERFSWRAHTARIIEAIGERLGRAPA